MKRLDVRRLKRQQGELNLILHETEGLCEQYANQRETQAWGVSLVLIHDIATAQKMLYVNAHLTMGFGMNCSAY